MHKDTSRTPSTTDGPGVRDTDDVDNAPASSAADTDVSGTVSRRGVPADRAGNSSVASEAGENTDPAGGEEPASRRPS